MPAASILIKPASSACNLRCRYCFYRALSGTRGQSDCGMMQEDTLEALVKNALSYADDFCSFAFQGGEPMLAGLPFYETLIRLQETYNTKKLRIQNTIQTNGTMIDENWARFFARHHWLVGLSLDGDRRANSPRVDSAGSETLARVLEAARLLEKHGVEYNIVSVVTALSAERAGAVYQYFKKKKFQYLQFIPCLDAAPGAHSEDSLTPQLYGRFLSELFDLWYADYLAGYDLDIRMFSNWVQMAAGYQPESCGMSGRCTCYFVVEGNGNVYPCDFYASDEWLLGTVHDRFQDLMEGEKARRFVTCSLPVDPKCSACKHLFLCRGGCRRWREPFVDGEPSLNCLCGAYEIFFEHCADRIYQLGQALHRAMQQPCGSTRRRRT